MNRIRLIFSELLVALFMISISFAQKGNTELLIRIHPVFNDSVLILNNKPYVTSNGDTIFIDAFRFYISNLNLIGETSQYSESESYHLVDAEDSSTLSFVIKNIPKGRYNGLKFGIGVDSLKNVSGALSGDLDPIKGMYWAWNTGYIAAKLIGHSNACKTLHHSFEYHIGGYLYPNNTYRESSIKFSEQKLSSGGLLIIELFADIAEWFKNPNTLDVSTVNSIVLPNAQAVMLADNYKDMVRLKVVNVK